MEAKDRLYVTNLLKMTQFYDVSIAGAVAVEPDFVSKIRKELGL